MNGKAQSISEEIEILEREISISFVLLAINDPAEFKAKQKKIERLRKQFIAACNK